MQARGAARGGGVGTPMPRGDGRLGGLLAVAAILVVFALMAAMTWGMGAPATGGLGAEDANLKAGAGAAVVHDDAGSMSSGVSSTVVHDDAGNMAPGAGSLVVHDDAGNVKPYQGSEAYRRLQRYTHHYEASARRTAQAMGDILSEASPEP